MRQVNKTFNVYEFSELSEAVQQKLINKYEIEPNWHTWALEDLNGNFESYRGIKSTVTGFDLECKNITIKGLTVDTEALSSYFIGQNFSRQLTKAEYYRFKSESRFILSLDISLKRYTRNDSMLDIKDPYSGYYEGLNNVRIDMFIEGLFTDYKHDIRKQLQDEYNYLTSELNIKEELAQYEYLKNGTEYND